MFLQTSFDSEIIVLTGVSGQLGAAYCRMLLSAGAKVAGLDLSESDSVLRLKEDFPKNFQFFAVDVTNRLQLEDASTQISAAFGRPTALINNAAIDSPPNITAAECGPFETFPDESFDRVMEVNVKGVFLCCKVFGSVMAAHGKGSIVNVSSIYGVVSPDQSIYDYRRRRGEIFFKPIAYSVSKSAILNLTRYLAVYWAKKNVRVNNLVISGVFNGQEKDFIDAYCSRIPVGRMAAPDDFVGPIAFLISNASRYMTGSTLTVDGGWTAI